MIANGTTNFFIEWLSTWAVMDRFVAVIISFVIGAALCVVLLAAPAVMSLMLAEIILLVQYVALGVYYTVRLLNQ
jgi:hypothetical protein